MPAFFRWPLLLPSLGLITILSSCQVVFQSLYGIHGIRRVSAAEVQILADRYHIPRSQVAVLDTSYGRVLAYLHHQSLEAEKNHYQPLQASYYDRNGQLQRFYINCYAGGFPNLTWNATGGFKQFPPAPQAPADTLLPLAAYLHHLRTTDGAPLPAPPTADYTVVVQWSRFMGRQSRRFIREVQRNAARATPNQSVQLLFVNNDDFEAYLYQE